MMLFQWNMTLRYIRNYLRYSSCWTPSWNFSMLLVSAVLKFLHLLPLPFPPPPSTDCRKINKKKNKKFRNEKKTWIKCKVCLKKQQDMLRGATEGAVHKNKCTANILLKLPSISRQAICRWYLCDLCDFSRCFWNKCEKKAKTELKN